MRNIIISDMHGNDPCEDVKREQKQSGVERAIFLGDYDTPRVLNKIRKLRIPKIFIPGNHELHYMKRLYLSSPLMDGGLSDYVLEWNGSPKQKKFLQNLIAGKARNGGLIFKSKAGKRNIVCCHASIIDEDIEFYDPVGGASEITRCVWDRFNESDFASLNFAEMARQNYWVMFRGHDHQPSLLRCSRQGKFKLEEPRNQTLNVNSRYIVTVGAFYRGRYALFDDKSGALEFVNTGF